MNWSEIFLTNGRISPVLIIWAFYVAVIISTVIYYSVTARLGKIISALINAEAIDPESALTIDEAKIKPSFFTKICLKSPMNYKNLLVAITSDGKFYANMRYTDEKPLIKQLTAVVRAKRNRVSSADTDSKNDTDATTVKENDVQAPTTTYDKPERVNFNPFTAKYYIPKEVHVRANGLFKPSKTNVLLVIAALIGLGVVIYFAGYFIDDFIASTSALFGN
jgi:hypothetical protein